MESNRISMLRTKGLMLVSASVISLTLATQATSQDTRWWASIEGAQISREGSDPTYSPIVEVPIEGDATSFAAEIGMNSQNSPWSVSAGLRVTSTSDVDFYGYRINGPWFYSDEGVAQETITTLDLEVGRDVGIGSFEGRITVGLRGVLYDASLKGTYYDGGWGYDYNDFDLSSQFSGVGPRVTIEGSMPLAEKVSLDVEAGAAVLFGQRTETGYAESWYGYYEVDESSNETVTNVDASVAVSYAITDNAKASLGYRLESFSGLGSNYAPDTVVHGGPFLKFTAGF